MPSPSPERRACALDDGNLEDRPGAYHCRFCGAAPDEPVRGTFSEISGQIVTDPDPSRSTATATIALSSVSTGNDERDAHLLSKEAT
jgi:hypothetical protein